LYNGEDLAVPRVLDIYAALPSVTGKLELEYEGEIKGGEAIARELVRISTGKVFGRRVDGLNLSGVVQWFESGGSLKLDELADSATLVHRMRQVQGLFGLLKALGVTDRAPSAVLASAAEFILEGLYAQKRISRSEEVGFFAEAKPKPPVSVEPHRLRPTSAADTTRSTRRAQHQLLPLHRGRPRH